MANTADIDVYVVASGVLSLNELDKLEAVANAVTKTMADFEVKFNVERLFKLKTLLRFSKPKIWRNW